jgi:hypothetical protein
MAVARVLVIPRVLHVTLGATCIFFLAMHSLDVSFECVFVTEGLDAAEGAVVIIVVLAVGILHECLDLLVGELCGWLLYTRERRRRRGNIFQLVGCGMNGLIHPSAFDSPLCVGIINAYCVLEGHLRRFLSSRVSAGLDQFLLPGFKGFHHLVEKRWTSRNQRRVDTSTVLVNATPHALGQRYRTGILVLVPVADSMNGLLVTDV